MHNFLGDGSVLAMAHRGGARENPENTLEAFEHAINLGIRYIESDVQATADGVLVMFHDFTLDRLAGRPGRIADLSWAEVQELNILESGTVPRFEDVLTAWPEVCFNLDAKTADAVTPLCRLMNERNCFDRICLASFSDKSITAIREELGSQLCTAAAQGEGLRFMMEARLGLTPAPLKADCLQLPPKAGPLSIITPRVLAAASQAGIAVHAWTIDQQEEMQRLLDLGIGGIMTDRPTLLMSVLEARSAGQLVPN